MNQRKFEKNIFLNEDNLLRIHLLNGNDVIIRCESNGDTFIEYKDEDSKELNVISLSKKENNVNN